MDVMRSMTSSIDQADRARSPRVAGGKEQAANSDVSLDGVPLRASRQIPADREDTQRARARSAKTGSGL